MTKTNRNLVLISVSVVHILFSSGCSNYRETELVKKIQHNRFDLPEVNGHVVFDANVNISNQKEEIIYRRSTSAVRFNVDNSEISNEGMGASFKGGIGLSDHFELGFKADRDQILSAKLMLLGKPRNVAKKGNTSLALTYGLGGTLDDNFIFIPVYYFIFGDDPGEEDRMSSKIRDFSVIAGYRFVDNLLLYAGRFKTKYSSVLRYSLSSGARFNDHFNIDYSGYNVGLNYTFNNTQNFHYNFLLEYEKSEINSGNNMEDNGTLGLGFGVLFK